MISNEEKYKRSTKKKKNKKKNNKKKKKKKKDSASHAPSLPLSFLSASILAQRSFSSSWSNSSTKGDKKESISNSKKTAEKSTRYVNFKKWVLKGR